MSSIYVDARFTGRTDDAIRAAVAIAQETGGMIFHRGNGTFEVRDLDTVFAPVEPEPTLPEAA